MKDENDDGREWGYMNGEDFVSLPKTPLLLGGFGPPPFEVSLPSGDVRHVVHRPEVEWLTLTHRQMELMLWQMLMDMGGEVSTIPPDDLPSRRVLFCRDQEYVAMVAQDA